ncbi:MAG: Cytochrome c oxidase assembly protein cox15 [Paramarteilia canceri]
MILRQLLPNALTRTKIGYWFFGCSAISYSTVLVGGLTRLNEAGLSMVDWHIIKGVKPPTNAVQWNNEFKKYRKYPEFE